MPRRQYVRVKAASMDEFADGENTLHWITIIPPGRAQVIAQGRRLASVCRRRVQDAISSLLPS